MRRSAKGKTITRLSWLGAGLCLGLLCLAGTARADDDDAPVDCQNATTQTDMNICADRDEKAADAALNAQYKKTRAASVDWDDNADGADKGAEAALLKAQRAWVAFRDAECDAEGFQAQGGSMQPMIISGCLATLTKQRTKELKDLAEALEN